MTKPTRAPVIPLNNLPSAGFRKATEGYGRLRKVAEGCGRFRRNQPPLWSAYSTIYSQPSTLNPQQVLEGYGRLRKATEGYGRLRKATEGCGRLRKVAEGYGRLTWCQPAVRTLQRRFAFPTPAAVLLAPICSQPSTLNPQQVGKATEGYGRFRRSQPPLWSAYSAVYSQPSTLNLNRRLSAPFSPPSTQRQ